MGEVFVARRRGQGDFEKDVALKLLLPHLVTDAEFTQRFFDEARLVARMNHPNIVQLFDVGDADGRPYLAMALVESISLGSLLKAARARNEQLPVPVIRYIALCLLEALGYAHALTGPNGPLNVVHRDVTPSNILVSTAGAVMLTDFGIARAHTNVHQTQPGRVRGKFAYMAPEHATSRPLDLRADLWSAGVTLYEALTLVSPFTRGADVDTMDAVIRSTPALASALRKDVTPGLAKGLARALSKDPAERFASAKAMREALLDGPVATAPELADLVQRWCGAELRARFGGVASGPELPGTLSVPRITPVRPNDGPVPQVEDRHTAATVALPAQRRVWPFVALGVGLAVAVAAVVFALQPTQTPPAQQPIVTRPPPPLPKPEPIAAPVVEPEPVEPLAVLTPTPEPALAPEPVKAGTTRTKKQKTKTPVEKTPTVASVAPNVEASRPPPPVELKVGYLTADAAPWATVLLDGKVLDRTPLSRFPVPEGAHTLVFRAADGREKTRPIQVEAGKVTTERVEFR